MSASFPYDATFLDHERNAFKVAAHPVSWDAFDMLRTSPLLGRTFTANDAKPGSEVFFIMAHSLWTTYFDSDPGNR